MKKILLSCCILSLLPFSFGAVVDIECNTISGSSGCDSCFKEQNPLYTCNTINQSCENKEGITLMSDVVTNTATTGNKVMYDNDEGQVYVYPLQGVTWSKSASQLLDMFQWPQEYIAGRENFTVGPTASWSTQSNAYIGYKLTPGSSVKWIEFKPNQWLRPDYIGNNTTRTVPALRAEFIPRLYTSATNYIDHKQCVFYYVRFCGDGTPDPDKGEQCDDGNMTNGDGCSNSCLTETSTPTCNNLTITPTTIGNNGGTISAQCAGSNATQYKFLLKKGSSIVQTIPYQVGSTASFTLDSASSNDSYTVECYVKNNSSSDITSESCKKDIDVQENPIYNPSISIEKDDSDNLDDEQEVDEGETATFSIKVINNGTEKLQNIAIDDPLTTNCNKDKNEVIQLLTKIGNQDSIFDPGEQFAYICRNRIVTKDTFPDKENKACVEADGLTSNTQVEDCDTTKIIFREKQDEEDEEETPICENIDSSKGVFGGAPFRTTITCEVESFDTCEIKVMKDGKVINTYESCSSTITFSDTGDYDVACVVNDEESSECEMEITVESMTDVPTGTKIFLMILISIILGGCFILFSRKQSS